MVILLRSEKRQIHPSRFYSSKQSGGFYESSLRNKTIKASNQKLQ